MVGAVTNYQKPLAIRKIKRRKAGESSMREIRKLKKNSEHFVNKVPYKHLLREFSSNMNTLLEEEAVTRKSVNILQHDASWTGPCLADDVQNLEHHKPSPLGVPRTEG